MRWVPVLTTELALRIERFVTLGLPLATVGLYGILAYSVSRRPREIGVRVALGARGSDVTHMVLREGMGWRRSGS